MVSKKAPKITAKPRTFSSVADRLDRLSKIKSIKNHPYFDRWSSILTRSGVRLDSIDAKEVCREWCYPTEVGFPNFLRWLISELRQVENFLIRDAFSVKRKNVNKPWSPDNCYVAIKGQQLEKKTEETIKKEQHSLVKEPTMSSIDFMITPMRVTQKDIEVNPQKLVELCVFAGSSSKINYAKAMAEVSSFVSKKTDEVYLLQNEESESILMLFFCRYPHLRMIHITGIFTIFTGVKELEAVKLAIGLLDDELDYVNYSTLLLDVDNIVHDPSNKAFWGMLTTEGFVSKTIGNKTFFAKE